MRREDDKKIFIATGISLACLIGILVPTIVVPLILNNKKNEKNTIDNKLIDSYKNLFIHESETKINNLFFAKNSRLNENITKEEISESISFNKNTFLYKEVEKYNKNIDEIDSLLVNEIYDMYQDEINTSNTRCGSIFRKHFWTATYMKGRALILNAMSIAWWGIQLAPAIADFVINLNGFH